MKYASALGWIALLATFDVSGMAQIAKPDLPNLVPAPLNAGTTDVPAVVQPKPITAPQPPAGGAVAAPVQAPPDPEAAKVAPQAPKKIVLPVSVIPDELKSKASIAAQHGRANQLAEALALYTEVLAASPQLFTMAFERGKVHQQMKDHAKAIADFSSAIKSCPDHYEAYFSRCVSHHTSGAHALAVTDCSKAIQLNPVAPNYYYYRGLAYMALKTWDKAAADLASSVDINPDETEIHLLLARVYSELDQLIPALREYTIVLQQRPGNPEAYKGRSTIKAMLGDSAGSQDDLKKIAR